MKLLFIYFFLIVSFISFGQNKPLHTINNKLNTRYRIWFTSKHEIFYLDENGKGIIYDFTSAKTIKVYERNQLPAWFCCGKSSITPNGENVIVAYNEIELFNLGSKSAITTYSHNSRTSPSCMAINHSGQEIVSGFPNGMIYVWNVNSGQILSKWDAHPKPVTSILFSNDDRLIISGSESQRILIWDKNRQGIAQLYPEGSVESLAISADDKYLLSSNYNYDNMNKWVTLWNLETQKEITRIADNMYGKFSPNGKYFATYDNQKALLRIWNLQTQKNIKSIQVNCEYLMFSPDGNIILTANDAGIMLWNIGNMPTSAKEISKANATSIADWEAIALKYTDDNEIQTKVKTMLVENAQSVEDWINISRRFKDQTSLANSKIKSLFIKNANSPYDWAMIVKKYPDQKMIADKKAFEQVGYCSVSSINSYLDNFPNGTYRIQVKDRLRKAYECEIANAKTSTSRSSSSSGSSSSRSSSKEVCKNYCWFHKVDEDSMEETYYAEFRSTNSISSGYKVGDNLRVEHDKKDGRWRADFSDSESSYSNAYELLNDAFYKKFKKISGCSNWQYYER